MLTSLDVAFINEEDLATPWKPEKSSGNGLNISLLATLKITLANLIYFEKVQLPQGLINRLIRLAAFPNPEFYKAQAMRMSVWDKPRGCLNANQHDQLVDYYMKDMTFMAQPCKHNDSDGHIVKDSESRGCY